MTKAWDMTDLVARLKANGLVMVEKEAKDATVAILGWAKESLVLGGGIAAIVAPPVIDIVLPLALAAEDKIDGVSGN